MASFLGLKGGSPHWCRNLEGDVYSVGVSNDEKNGGRQGGKAHFLPRAKNATERSHSSKHTHTTNVLVNKAEENMKLLCFVFNYILVIVLHLIICHMGRTMTPN